jgi:hypothetical protein
MTLNRWRGPLPGASSYAVPSQKRMSLWIFEGRRSPIIRADIVPAGIFPDYECPITRAKLRKLGELPGR